MSRAPNALLVSTGEPNAGLAKVAKQAAATLFAAQRPVVASGSQVFVSSVRRPRAIRSLAWAETGRRELSMAPRSRNPIG
jgi:hypothetical protein